MSATDSVDTSIAAATLRRQIDAAQQALAIIDPGIRIQPPAPGVAWLACRCGRVLSAGQIHRRRHPRLAGDAPGVQRIVCVDCARPDKPIGGTPQPEPDDVVWTRGGAA